MQIFEDLIFNDTHFSKQINLVNETVEPLLVGNQLSKKEGILHERVAVINYSTAKEISKRAPKAVIGKGIEIDGHIYQIVGVEKKQDTSTFNFKADIKVPQQTVKYYSSNREQITKIDVELKKISLQQYLEIR